MASTWKRVNELLLIGDLDLKSKIWTADMDDWETIVQVVRRYPLKLPVAGGMLHHASEEVVKTQKAAAAKETAAKIADDERVD